MIKMNNAVNERSQRWFNKQKNNRKIGKKQTKIYEHNEERKKKKLGSWQYILSEFLVKSCNANLNKRYRKDNIMEIVHKQCTIKKKKKKKKRERNGRKISK